MTPTPTQISGLPVGGRAVLCVSDLLACWHTFYGNSQVGHVSNTGLASWLFTKHMAPVLASQQAHSPTVPVSPGTGLLRRQMETLLRKLTGGASPHWFSTQPYP